MKSEHTIQFLGPTWLWVQKCNGLDGATVQTCLLAEGHYDKKNTKKVAVFLLVSHNLLSNNI